MQQLLISILFGVIAYILADLFTDRRMAIVIGVIIGVLVYIGAFRL